MCIRDRLFILYFGLIFWTIGYDTIYACQDIEDDAMVGIKSTARKFGGRLTAGIAWSYILSSLLIFIALLLGGPVFVCHWTTENIHNFCGVKPGEWAAYPYWWSGFIGLGFYLHLSWQLIQFSRLSGDENADFLKLFKSNFWSAGLFIIGLVIIGLLYSNPLTQP